MVEVLTDDLRAALYSCKSVLIKMQMLNDAPTSQRGFAEVPRGGNSDETQVPKGVRMGGDLTKRVDAAPSKQFSLYAHYLWRMRRAEKAQDVGELLKLAGCATRDYETYMHTRPSYHEKHEAAVTELLRDCRGQSAVEASWWLGTPVKWVRRQRVISGYDPENGEPRPRVDETTARIFALHEAGVSIRTIADEVHLSKSEVHRRLAA